MARPNVISLGDQLVRTEKSGRRSIHALVETRVMYTTGIRSVSRFNLPSSHKLKLLLSD
jgi:hypothetical protein